MPKEKTFKYDEPVFTIELSEMNDDWLRAVRLQKFADAGNRNAEAELRKMEETILKRPE